MRNKEYSSFFFKGHTDLTGAICFYISTWLVSNYNVDGNLLDLDCKILTDGL